MNKVVTLNRSGVTFILNNLNELFQNGEIEGLVVGVKLKSGEFISGSSDEISFLEKLGLSQAIINDVCYSANE